MFDFAPISPKIQRIFALTLLLLLVAAPRILRLGEISLNFDEAWSLYGSSGSWSEVMRWLDVNYPPLLLLLMKVLVGWFGSDPLVLRYVFVLIFLLGTAVLYRLVQRESGAAAAFLSVLTYGGVGYLIYASVELRAYGIMLAILPWVWFSASGFRCWASPWKATLFLAVTSALALYTSYLSAVPLAVFFLYVLWMQPRRWKQNLGYLFLAAALCAVLLLPLLGRLEGLLDLRESDSYRREILEPWFQAEAEVFRIWFANGGSYQRNGSWLYFLVLTLSVLGLIWRRRFSRFTTFLLVFSLGLLPILHLLNPLLGIYSHKQYVWILLGVATGLGHGLSMLPKLGRWLALTLLTFILVFLPKPQIRVAHLSGFTNLGASLAWLKGHWYAGDELIIAQAESCLPPTPNPPGKEPIGYWNQLLRASFPAGISLV